MSDNPQADARRLQASLASLRRVVVAYSGGVDSSVVAAAAQRASLDFLVAITADSPAVPRWQIELAKRVAGEIGIEHHLVATDEVEQPEYRHNDRSRCFYCKSTLYRELSRFVTETEVVMVSGTNADDLGDYRPGIEAGTQADVVTPLANLGIGKEQVRALAEHYGLSNHDLPASPCLASRIAYGVQVTEARLSRVEQAEQWLRERGLKRFRVRLHADELARIEVEKSEIPLVIQLNHDGSLSSTLHSYGFRFVTIDMDGFESGSMNRVLVPLSVDATGEGSASGREMQQSMRLSDSQHNAKEPNSGVAEVPS